MTLFHFEIVFCPISSVFCKELLTNYIYKSLDIFEIVSMLTDIFLTLDVFVFLPLIRYCCHYTANIYKGKVCSRNMAERFCSKVIPSNKH